ncbi:MAG: hypothetical protein AB7L17_21260 [Ilumatobacteraceae bacterium]
MRGPVVLRLRKESFGRSRWAAFGAAVAVSLGAGGIGWIAHAANTAPSTFVGITPCRLFDTRPAPDNVGDRNTPLAAGEELTRQVTGTNGNCNIPANATAIAYNLTVPTSISGYLTIFPADATRPTSSNINPVAGESVKANGGIVGLSSTGAIKVYTLTGPVNAILDITGYFTAAGGGTGVIPSGQTVTGEVVYDTHRSEQVSSSDRVGVDLPGVAPAPLTNATVNFASGGGDNDATCTGTLSEPTAPPGKVCIYLSASSGIGFMNGTVGNLPTRSFRINMDYAAGGGETDLFLIATWAYTAP